jgi:hypothetical protein
MAQVNILVIISDCELNWGMNETNLPTFCNDYYSARYNESSLRNKIPYVKQGTFLRNSFNF